MDEEWQFKTGDEIGPYRVTQGLAIGGTGEVYEAKHSFLPRTVALKVLQLLKAEQKDFKDRMRAEAGILCELDHPNVVRLFDAGMTDKTVWMAMELLIGKPLNHLVHALTSLSVPSALHIVAEVADGVHAAHEVGVIHRDLKPANIFVTDQNVVKVLDFGTSKFRDRGVKTTDRMRLFGTYAYMSPEHLLNSPTPDKRTDVFALGLIAYEMLLGQHPYADADGGVSESRSIGERIILFHPQPLSALVDVPEYVWVVISRALARNRDERYPAMADFAREARAARRRFMAERGVPEGLAIQNPAQLLNVLANPSQAVFAIPESVTKPVAPLGRGTIRMVEGAPPTQGSASPPIPPALGTWNPRGPAVIDAAPQAHPGHGNGPDSGPTPVMPNRHLAAPATTAAIPLVHAIAKPGHRAALATTEAARPLTPLEAASTEMRLESPPGPGPYAEQRKAEGTPAPMAFRGGGLDRAPRQGRPLRHAVYIGLAIGVVSAFVGVAIVRGRSARSAAGATDEAAPVATSAPATAAATVSPHVGAPSETARAHAAASAEPVPAAESGARSATPTAAIPVKPKDPGPVATADAEKPAAPAPAPKPKPSQLLPKSGL